MARTAPQSKGLLPIARSITVAAMDGSEISKAIEALKRSRPCRVCGQPFTPRRWDALYCTDTCKSRAHRGANLAYIDRLPEAARKEARARHAHIVALIEMVQAYTDAEQERRLERSFTEDIGREWRDTFPENMPAAMAANLLTKVIWRWRDEVAKALDDLPKRDRGDHTATVAALVKALPHIHPDVIDGILRKLLQQRQGT
jgi:hypothetical protein